MLDNYSGGAVDQNGNGRITCSSCNRSFWRKDFYVDKNGNPMHRCKKCMAIMIDINSPSTVMNIMKEIDIPFIPDEWQVLRERYEFTTNKEGNKVRNPNANQSILGRYIGKMKLVQYADLKFEDTDKFVKEHEERKQVEKTRVLGQIEQALEQGGSVDSALASLLESSGFTLGQENPKIVIKEVEVEPTQEPAEPELYYDAGRRGLKKSELKDLKIKWGNLYTEDELVRLETFYSEMHESYDITSASHEDYLKQIVKTSLRMHAQIDNGDYEGYKKLVEVYDKMMKSAKFTASQEKKEERFIDSISEMARLCEEVDFIPVYHTDEPQDIVDVTLRDMNNYTRNLIANELNLDDLIEKGLEQIVTEQERERESNDDDLLFDDDEAITDDDLLFEAVERDIPIFKENLTEEAKVLLGGDSIEQ